MRDVLPDVLDWWRAGTPAGLAIVTATWSSAPRPPGTAMAVGPDGRVVGSVSGGCVEAAVYELCREATRTGLGRLVRFGVSDDDAFEAGLTCGGTIELLVGPAAFPALPKLAAEIDAGRPVALVSRLCDGVPPRHRVITPADSGREASMLEAGRTGVFEYAGERALVSSFPPPPRMIVFGATEQAAATAEMGAFLGYRVTVCDARPVFATQRRLPGADEIVVDWPHRYLAGEARAGRLDHRTVLVVLTHDPKFDIPLLAEALRLPVAYVGAMGSRRTHKIRLDRLREAGVTEDQLSRLASPIGLDIGARTPAETAVSIAAEILAVSSRATAASLSTTDGPIHP